MLKGNQYLTSGKMGERINRTTKQLEARTNKLRKVRGSSYSALVIKTIMMRNNQFASITNIEDICYKIRQKITSKGDQFNTARIDSSI